MRTIHQNTTQLGGGEWYIYGRRCFAPHRKLLTSAPVIWVARIKCLDLRLRCDDWLNVTEYEVGIAFVIGVYCFVLLLEFHTF